MGGRSNLGRGGVRNDGWRSDKPDRGGGPSGGGRVRDRPLPYNRPGIDNNQYRSRYGLMYVPRVRSPDTTY